VAAWCWSRPGASPTAAWCVGGSTRHLCGMWPGARVSHRDRRAHQG
jgi:hypothetical protein